jgi:NarL family two-component system response regulator YdfI
MIRVAVAASIPSVRAGLRALLSADEGIAIVEEAATLPGLLLLAPEADVVVAVSPAEAPQAMAQSLDSLGTAALLLLVPDQAGLGDTLATILAKARRESRAWGVLPQDSSAEELRAAVHALYEGLLVGAPALLEPLLRRQAVEDAPAPADEEPLAEPLTEREAEVLQLVAQGLANKQIAAALTISEHTVKFHVSAIYTKLGAASRTEAVRLGVRKGLITL